MKTDNRRKLAWYEQVFDGPDFTTSEPTLDPYLNFEKYPVWFLNVTSELQRQALHLSPMRDTAVMTPEKAGKFWGQNCANNYVIQDHQRAGTENGRKLEIEKVLLSKLNEDKEKEAASSALHKKSVSESIIREFEKNRESTQESVHKAFKDALSQSNYSEAVEFFRGFAKGLSKPGIKAGTLALATDATPIYFEMFYNWQEVDQLGTVTELYDWLLKRGFTKETLGDIDRLRTLCKRIKYAPGKRGRPPKIKK
jgi:hypothetical protein